MLDLFDLDEAFSSEKVRLAQLTNKCKFGTLWKQALLGKDHRIVSLFIGTDDDLEFYVRKCGEIMGVTPKLDKDQRDAKSILEHIFFHLVEFKKLNQVIIVSVTYSMCKYLSSFFFAGKWSRHRTTPDGTRVVKHLQDFLIRLRWKLDTSELIADI